MKTLISWLLMWGIHFFVFSINDLTAQNPTKPRFEYFLSNLIKGDFDSNPDLDFVVITRQRPGQDHALDDIQNQPFQIISVHRGFTENASVLEKIRLEINEILSLNKFNRILVFGRYRAYPRLFNGIFDGGLELTHIDTFDKDGTKKIFLIEGIIGGVCGKKK